MLDLIDTHCHLTDLNDEEISAVMHRAEVAGVTRAICIGAGTGDLSATQAIEIAQRHDTIWATVGIHPHDADDFVGITHLEELIVHPKCVAIGETGLDYFKQWSSFENQRALFRNSIAVAKNFKKPLIIHCRDAKDDTLAIIRETKASEVGGVFHCYAEDENFARALVDLNFLVSFTGNITFKTATRRRSAVKHIPLTQMMTETDAPFMAPEPFRGQIAEPAHVRQVAEKIAEVKEVLLEEVAQATLKNARQLFRI